MPAMHSAENAQPATVTFAHLWLDGHWLRNALVTIDRLGLVTSVSETTSVDAGAGEAVPGLTLPGMGNAHCHAFQRALGPLTQRATLHGDDPGRADSFWTWRESMYALAARVDAQGLQAITARCYLELLRGGYTSVAEFLYLHRLDAGRQGELNADAAVAAAAALTGMRLTLLPTLYQYADFGGAPPRPGQRPFVRSTPQFLEDWSTLRRRYPADGAVTLGVAFHSLRAVDLAAIDAVLATVHDDERCRCLHIHVAEQVAEVAACVRQHGVAPVALMWSKGLLSPRWALVHATHADNKEMDRLREAGATLVLCPTTEADLGDGIVDIAEFMSAGGRLAIGSDSNIGRSASAELRLLEWTQRLTRGQRNVLANEDEPAVADRLYAAALRGGRRATGESQLREVEQLRADFVTFDPAPGDWQPYEPRDYLSALVFDGAALRAREVMVGGRWLIRDGHHARETEIEAEYGEALRRLLASGVSS
jgi:formimidoylglutamate deiminase